MQEAESDASDGEEDEPQEDHYALLVKAWEQKVFPVVRRRFRNEAERKDGLEQIKGALQLGEQIKGALQLGEQIKGALQLGDILCWVFTGDSGV